MYNVFKQHRCFIILTKPRKKYKQFFQSSIQTNVEYKDHTAMKILETANKKCAKESHNKSAGKNDYILDEEMNQLTRLWSGSGECKET